MVVRPKLVSYKEQSIPGTNRKIKIACWRSPKGWTQEEVDICTKYYQLQSDKLNMNIQRYMMEFH